MKSVGSSKGVATTFLFALVMAVASTAQGCSASGGSEAPGSMESAWTPGPPLPRAVANNAVVGLEVGGEAHVYSFLGVDESKRWDGVVDWAFRWVVGRNAWEELPPVPGPGRLAGTAEAWGGRVYLFGGYTVAADGSEASVPSVDVFDPSTDSWSSAAPMPVPVDDAVSGVWRDSLIVLVSGWHDTDNVADVQIYDPRADRWSASTPIPGPPVFGHAGKVAADRILYLGGANTQGRAPRYRIEPSSWVGEIGGQTPAVDWAPTSPYPGPPLYRAASGSVGNWLIFAGGTDNPYNYDGIGYDGVPAVPRASVFAYDVDTGSWAVGPSLPRPRMDHRALAVAGRRVVLAGGMDSDRSVSADVFVADVGALVNALEAAPPPTRD